MKLIRHWYIIFKWKMYWKIKKLLNRRKYKPCPSDPRWKMIDEYYASEDIRNIMPFIQFSHIKGMPPEDTKQIRWGKFHAEDIDGFNKDTKRGNTGE